jgi:hypothetical protein
LPQYFGTIAERTDRDGRILEHIDGVDAVLRRLRSHGISKAHLWIEPEVRLHCRTGTQRNVEAVRYVLFGQAKLRGTHAVDVEVKIGSVDDLCMCASTAPGTVATRSRRRRAIS